MHTFISFLVALALVPFTTATSGSGDAITIISSCPALIKRTICSTCVTADCVTKAVLTLSCGCPNPPTTLFTTEDCASGCAHLSGCATVYAVDSVAGLATCSGAPPPPAAPTGTGEGSATANDPSKTTAPPSESAGGASNIAPSTSAPSSVSTNGAGRQVPLRLW